MKIAFIARSTLYSDPGGDSVQIIETGKQLRKLDLQVNIHLTNEKIPYGEYDLFHFFNITRPADILYHIRRTRAPFVVSTIFIDHSEFDKSHRAGIPGLILRQLSPGSMEYVKALMRWVLRKDSLQSREYVWKGHTRSVREILKRTSVLLPNSVSEYQAIEKTYGIPRPFSVIPSGVDTSVFARRYPASKDKKLVLCAGRIEGRKNQLNLIKALNNTSFKLVLAGKAANNQKKYYEQCRKMAAGNIEFVDQLSQEKLAGYYNKASVHVLPSWFESCGFSTLEAAASGCNIVITDKGYTRDYYGDDAYYCDPGNPGSIYAAIEKAANNPFPEKLYAKILKEYTWQEAGEKTLMAYRTILSKNATPSV